jgi:Rrf2 family iron-sulfur cluster assembly transcriptional regulator
MVFSKTFGYSVRSILYMALLHDNKPTVSIDEIAEKLAVPRHFLGKVMKRLVKAKILDSKRGANGGYSLNNDTLDTALATLAELTGETGQFNSCVLRLRQCSSQNPCPLHHHAELLKKKWQELMATTTIRELLKKDQEGFINSLSTQ